MAEKKEINGQWYSFHPVNPNANEHAKPVSHEAGGGGGANLSYHGGVIIQTAHVVPIYWGAYWGDNTGSGPGERTAMNGFFSVFGTAPEYKTITQYYDTVGSTHFIGLSNLAGGAADWFDSSNPPTNVSDAAVQGEVLKYLKPTNQGGAGGTFDNSAIYEVFIPPTSFSSNGTSGSCGATGGVSLAYCAYHGAFTSGGNTIKYSIEPYPSCSGCKTSGFTNANNMQHFACHETREAVTDPVNAWWANSGAEADDKCAWSPTPFIGTGGYGYQYEWSNSARSCVKSTPIP